MVGMRAGLHGERPWSKWTGNADATRASREGGTCQGRKSTLLTSGGIKMRI